MHIKTTSVRDNNHCNLRHVIYPNSLKADVQKKLCRISGAAYWKHKSCSHLNINI